ncbi:MAG TPA: hypothetical protein VM099_01745 [Gemmatimonadaceae bacterium]|nr:hypothetical protein [Gemmatimonadaceae bacterium]
MLLVREVFHCKPGKVRALTDMFKEMNKLQDKAGMGRLRLLTDFCGARYWTLVAEMEVSSLKAFEDMMAGVGMDEATGKEFERAMKGYHDLVEQGHREIYKIEAEA